MTAIASHYRLYTLNPQSARMVVGSDLLADGDEEAIRVGADMHPDGESFEIWCGQRLVFRSLEPGAGRESR